ncbi:MAG: hypothetical protein ACR2QS_16585 [Woeseiaceae bacterium]
MSAPYTHLDPFLAQDDAANMLSIAERFGSFSTYADEATSDSLGEELPQRFDAALNYIESGIDGSGNPDDRETAIKRTNYFRETYVYGDEIMAPGIEPFMEHPDIADAARRISGREIVVPSIIYANLLVPGQELAMHTDVPEFRGANRMLLPQWLIVVMLHSGLFDEWRIPIVTCVSWFGAAKGGAFTFYPDGRDGDRESIAASHNSAILIDTDSVFHGVERVARDEPDMPEITQDTRLHYLGGEQWQLRNGDVELENISWPNLRYSISWKAYCFRDEAEERLWRDGSDDLSLDLILERLENQLREMGVLAGPRPDPTSYAMMLVKTFVRFPG